MKALIERIKNELLFLSQNKMTADQRLLLPYFTFKNYKRIWLIGVIILSAVAIAPLLVVTAIHYQLVWKSVDHDLVLRTERVTSNARRALTFFMQERLNALRFTINEIPYAELEDSNKLSNILRNLKLGFGGLTDLSIINHTGRQVAYAGPYNLEGKDYSKQPWFMECLEKNAYVSEIFLGYRSIPHIIIAVKSYRPDGEFFILRATLETEQIIEMLDAFKTGEHAEIFLINRDGILQTPSVNYGNTFEKMPLPIPEYSDHTHASMMLDNRHIPVIIGYAYIEPQVAPTRFILMVVKQKALMTGIWTDLQTNINWFVTLSIFIIAVVIVFAATYIINRLYRADRDKAEAMVHMEQNNQLASIGQLAAGVAHEINNPLALINETAGYLKDLVELNEISQCDTELIEHVDSIMETVDRCGIITRQLLGFARKFDISVQKLSIKEILSDILDFHEKESQYRNINVMVDIPENIPDITTDRGKLQQILMNLINNAFQALSDCGSLKISAESKESGSVEIHISDSGCGISDVNLRKIFEPFFTTKAEGKGTGLGLSITYGLVQKLHGKISVESKEGIGTTFHITLPVSIDEETIQ